jgi:damage-control phosphatase, subfamily I
VHTALDCLPCLLEQALFAVRRATDCQDLQQAIMAEMAQRLSALDLQASPPENSMVLYGRIAERTGSPDPFAGLKTESTRLAQAMQPRQSARIAAATDPLLTAIRLAIAGNVIDYGAPHQLQAEEVVEGALTRPLVIDDYAAFRHDLARAENVLYLADNCGELIFDSLLIEQLDRKVVLAVRDKPIINDALAEDARQCGLERRCRIISNGTACPGTPLPLCSHAFKETFRRADLIISKGQGNFETLSTTPAPLYFLLTVKCRVVAAHIAEITGVNVRIGEPVLLKSRATGGKGKGGS